LHPGDVIRRQSQQPAPRATETVMGCRCAGGQGGCGQQGSFRGAGGSRRRRHQGDVVINLGAHPQRAQLGFVITVGGYRDERGITAIQPPFQGGHQQGGSRARCDVQRAQNCYAGSSASRDSSNGQPLAANRARTRSTSSDDGSSSVIWVIITPMS